MDKLQHFLINVYIPTFLNLSRLCVSRQSEEIISVIYHQEIELNLCLLATSYFSLFAWYILLHKSTCRLYCYPICTPLYGNGKERIIGISISFYLVIIDKLFMLQHKVMWDWQLSCGSLYINYTIICNPYLQTSLWCEFRCYFCHMKVIFIK